MFTEGHGPTTPTHRLRESIIIAIIVVAPKGLYSCERGTSLLEKWFTGMITTRSSPLGEPVWPSGKALGW